MLQSANFYGKKYFKKSHHKPDQSHGEISFPVHFQRVFNLISVLYLKHGVIYLKNWLDVSRKFIKIKLPSKD